MVTSSYSDFNRCLQEDYNVFKGYNLENYTTFITWLEKEWCNKM